MHNRCCRIAKTLKNNKERIKHFQSNGASLVSPSFDLDLHFFKDKLFEFYLIWKYLENGECYQTKKIIYVLSIGIFTLDDGSFWRSRSTPCTFDCEYLVNGKLFIYIEALLLPSNRNYYMLFWLAYLHFTLVHSKSKVKVIKVSTTIISFCYYCHRIGTNICTRWAYLHLTLVYSKAYSYFDCKYLVNGHRYNFEHFQSNGAINVDVATDFHYLKCFYFSSSKPTSVPS